MARKVFDEAWPLGRHFEIVRGAPSGAAPQSAKGAFEVVGVVRDSKYWRLDQAAPPTLFVPHTQVGPGSMIVEVRAASDPLALVPAIREMVRRVDTRLPLEDVKTQRQQIANTIGKPRAFAVLTAVSALIGLLLACIGLYGIVSYDATRRTTEIGIRIALGARRFDVVRLVVRETMIVVGIGAAIGLLLVAVSSRLVGSVLFGVRPSDPPTIAAAMLVMIAVASLAASVPARRAARLDPTAALRYE
jgi:ABC-type antimicrobial peptide transport system permease subunit